MTKRYVHLLKISQLFGSVLLISLCLSGQEIYAQIDPLFTKKAIFQSLSDRWELDSATRRGTFLVTPYKPLYVTAGRWSSDPNEQPVSENPTYNYPFNIPLGRYEARWQLSLKVKVL